MSIATDVAREIVASRQVEARRATLGTAARLARRQHRLHRRMQRVDQRLIGH